MRVYSTYSRGQLKSAFFIVLVGNSIFGRSPDLSYDHRMRTYPFELELFLSDCSPWISRLDEIDDSLIEIIQEKEPQNWLGTRQRKSMILVQFFLSFFV